MTTDTSATGAAEDTEGATSAPRPDTRAAHKSHRDDRRRSVRSILDETDDSLRRGARPGALVWPCGFDLLDSTLDGGLRSGELVLLGGSEGSGKTTLAVQMVRNAVAAGRHAVVFSFEHEAHTLLQRLISMEAAAAATKANQHPSSAADVHLVRHVFESDDPDRRGLADALGALPFGPQALEAVDGYASRLHIHESNNATTTDEIATVLQSVMAEAGEPPMVLVDYLQKVPSEGYHGDEVSRVTYVVETLKDMALELSLPIVAITAADRESLGAGHRMRTRDLRGSSALAYEADVVLILSSKENVISREHLVYDLGSIKKFRRWSVVSIEKNRHGMDNVELELQKDFEHGRFHPSAQVVSERLIEERVFTT